MTRPTIKPAYDRLLRRFDQHSVEQEHDQRDPNDHRDDQRSHLHDAPPTYQFHCPLGHSSRINARHRRMLGSSVPNDSVVCPHLEHVASTLSTSSPSSFVSVVSATSQITLIPLPLPLVEESTRGWHPRPSNPLSLNDGRQTINENATPRVLLTNPSSRGHLPDHRDGAGVPLS